MKDCNLQSSTDSHFFASLDIDKRDSYGKTALHCAVSAGQANTVKYLLHNHANPNLKDHREEAPLHAAVRTGNIEVVEVEFKELKLHFWECCVRLGKVLDDKRSDQNHKSRALLCTMAYFLVSFFFPFVLSHNSCASYIFSPQAILNHKTTNVNIEGRNKYTPLHSAAHLEHRSALEICQKLVSITWITRWILIKHT